MIAHCPMCSSGFTICGPEPLACGDTLVCPGCGCFLNANLNLNELAIEVASPRDIQKKAPELFATLVQDRLELLREWDISDAPPTAYASIALRVYRQLKKKVH